jgi:1-acylglycerone phosphate reductase
MSRKSVLITGCSKGGIGHSLALEWHSRGYRVFATARRLEVMSDLQEVGIECLKMDVTDTTSLKKIKEEVEQKTGGTLDVLINNAGLGIFPHMPS